MFSLSSSIRYSCGVSGGVPQPGTHDCGEMPVSRLVFFFFFFMPISFFFHISMVPLWRPGQTGFLFWLAFRDPLYASRHNGGLIEPNRITFDWKSNGKLSPRSYPIQCERKWKHSFFSAQKKSQIYHGSAAYFRCAVAVSQCWPPNVIWGCRALTKEV